MLSRTTEYGIRALIFIQAENLKDKRPKVSEIAEWVELDVPLFKECMRSELKDKFVQADYDLGIDMGVGGTPSLFINGEVFDDWEYDAITAKIDSLLAE